MLIYRIPGLQFNLLPLVILLVSLIALSIFCVRNACFFKDISLASGLIYALAYTTMGVLSSCISEMDKGNDPIAKAAGQISSYQAIVLSDREMSGDHGRYIVKIQRVKTAGAWEKAVGKCLLYLRNDTLNNIDPGTRIIVSGQPQTIAAPKNPGEFDYRKFLLRKGISSRHFTDANALAFLPGSEGSQWTAFAVLRGQLRNMLQTGMPENEHWGVVSAMLLGDKKGIPDDLRSAYANAGASHILAVSGLHVGIIYLLILASFGWMRHRRILRLPFYILSLAGIWSFAAITAFTPSVTRAGIMITIIILGQATGSKPVTLNSLAAAAFIMLLFDPDLVFDVGFQLSFGAVFGIALFYSRIYGLLQFRHFLADYGWKIASISLAAQIPIAPLIIYYFHQLPLLSPVTGIIVIPAASLIIFLTIGFLFLGIIAPSFAFAAGGIVLAHTVKMLNTLILLIESLPFSSISDLYITPYQAVLLLVFILLSAFVFLYKQHKLLKPALAVGLLMLLSGVVWHEGVLRQKKIIVYSVDRRAVAIDLIKGKNFLNYCYAAGADCEKLDYYTTGARLKYGVKFQSPGAHSIHFPLQILIFWHSWGKRSS